MKRYGIIFAVALMIILSGIIFHSRPKTMDNATKRTERFLQAINQNKPEDIYGYLTPSIRALITKDGFMQNFAKERSYPYLTPLYLYLDQIELSDDGTEGKVTCIVASRLPGEKMTFRIVFVKNNYYIHGFEEIADGSYIEKFDRL